MVQVWDLLQVPSKAWGTKEVRVRGQQVTMLMKLQWVAEVKGCWGTTVRTLRIAFEGMDVARVRGS